MRKVGVRESPALRQKVLGMLIHCYTASGSVIGFFALLATSGHNFRLAFLLLLICIVVDYSDGTLARWLRVQDSLPSFDGDKLDTFVDFFNDTLVPVYLLWEARRLPSPAYLWIILMLMTSSLRLMKSDSPLIEAGRFRGLPVPWLFVAFYLFYLPVSPAGFGLIVALVAVLSFSQFGYIHVARFGRGIVVNALILGGWWVVYLLITQEVVVGNKMPLLIVSFVFPLYYLCTPWLFRKMPTSSL